MPFLDVGIVRRGETGSEKNLQSQDNPGLKKDVNKDWQGSEQRTGSSPNLQMRKNESSSSEKNVEEERRAPKRKNQSARAIINVKESCLIKVH